MAYTTKWAPPPKNVPVHTRSLKQLRLYSIVHSNTARCRYLIFKNVLEYILTPKRHYQTCLQIRLLKSLLVLLRQSWQTVFSRCLLKCTLLLAKISAPGKLKCVSQTNMMNWIRPLNKSNVLICRSKLNTQTFFLEKWIGMVLISKINTLDFLKSKESNLHTYFKSSNISLLHR